MKSLFFWLSCRCLTRLVPILPQYLSWQIIFSQPTHVTFGLAHAWLAPLFCRQNFIGSSFSDDRLARDKTTLRSLQLRHFNTQYAWSLLIIHIHTHIYNVISTSWMDRIPAESRYSRWFATHTWRREPLNSNLPDCPVGSSSLTYFPISRDCTSLMWMS